MKSILAVTLIVGIVAGEVPSHSYLPPPPRGYPQASSPPSVIAARTLNLQNPEHHNHDLQNPEHHNHDLQNPDHQNPNHQNPDHHIIDHGVAAVRSSLQPQEYSTPNPRYNDEQGYEQTSTGYPRNGVDDVNTTVNYSTEGYPKTYDDTVDLTRSTGYNENANNIRSSNGYPQEGGRYNGYQGNAPNGDRYHSNDQNGGRYQDNQNERRARSNFN